MKVMICLLDLVVILNFVFVGLACQFFGKDSDNCFFILFLFVCIWIVIFCGLLLVKIYIFLVILVNIGGVILKGWQVLFCEGFVFLYIIFWMMVMGMFLILIWKVICKVWGVFGNLCSC